MSGSIDILRGVMDEIRLAILLILYKKDGLKAREILGLLNKEELNIPNLLYHLKILESSKLIYKDEKKEYFLSELGRVLAEIILSLDNLNMSAEKKEILIPEYPFIEDLSSVNLAKFLKELLPTNSSERVVILNIAMEKIKNLGTNFLFLDELLILLRSIYLERKQTNTSSNISEILTPQQNSALTNLRRLTEEVQLLKGNLAFINIPSLDTYFEKAFERRISNYSKMTSIDSIEMLFQLYQKLLHVLNNYSDGIALASPAQTSFPKLDLVMLRALLFLLSHTHINRLSLVYHIDESSNLAILLKHDILKDFEGKLLPNGDLYLEIGKDSNVTNEDVENVLKALPYVHFVNNKQSSISTSSFGFFDESHEWSVGSIISINLPRLSIESKSDDSKFIDRLLTLLSMSSQMFILKKEALNKHGIDARFYVNLIGIFESIYIHTRNTIKEPSSNRFARKLLEECNKTLKEISEKFGIQIRIASVNDFESGFLFANNDLNNKKQVFPEKLRPVLRSYGYSSGIIPYWLAFSKLRDRFMLEHPLLVNLDGGYSSEIYLTVNSINEGVVKEILDMAFLKYSLLKLDIITVVPVCSRCYSLLYEQKCSRCGSSDKSFVTREKKGGIKYFKIEDLEEPRML
ncbi:MAG TPA: anaerobic ribonucleoside-triphosphate reductase, partial [Geobacterales bacterium]|nr:anaerobic ribonucleoside-triphosphate reductase [Geobacterales bacterium]